MIETVDISEEAINETHDGVIVVNIKFKTTINSKRKPKIKISELPTKFVLEIPSDIMNSEDLENAVESFVYNALTKKFGYEVIHCQIFLS